MFLVSAEICIEPQWAATRKPSFLCSIQQATGAASASVALRGLPRAFSMIADLLLCFMGREEVDEFGLLPSPLFFRYFWEGRLNSE